MFIINQCNCCMDTGRQQSKTTIEEREGREGREGERKRGRQEGTKIIFFSPADWVDCWALVAFLAFTFRLAAYVVLVRKEE